MKNKKIFRTLAALCICLVLMGGFSVTAFAQGTDPAPAATPAADATNDSNVVVEETTEDSPPLTPEGNAALVDDYGGNKQLITVTTKAGNYFYILIDRANEDKETAVHFLNQVDEADLMALMEDGETTEETPAVCNCTEKCAAGAVNTACPVCAVNMAECTGQEPEPTPVPETDPEPEQEPAGLNPAMLLKLSQAATPYDLTVISDVSIDGDSDITDYLATCDVQMSDYAKNMEQISVYDADMTYADLFAGQDLNLWPIDEAVPQSRVSVISISDFNRALAMQGKGPVALNEGEYLLNCNYEGTYQYVMDALRTHSELSVAGVVLQRASDEVLQETYVMTSVGNNDRGTLIVPDSVVTALTKDVNALLVQYKEGTDPDEVLQKMIPIGLDETHGYRYSEKNMLYDMFYGINALVTFICCYVGLIFLLICAALLALKQLTETTDNIFRYGLLQKLGAKQQQINRTLLVQTGVFFAVPLIVAGLYSILLIGKGMEIVEEFMNIHIATNVGLTIILFLIVYGSYFIATYLSCKRMVTEQKEMEV